MNIQIVHKDNIPDDAVIVSASQLKCYKSCKRKWGWLKIDKIPVEKKPGLLIGSAVHEEAENWLKNGILPDESKVIMVPNGPRYPGKIFRAGIHLLPAPKTVLVELKFYLLVDGVYFLGYIDCLDPKDRLVADHKSTTSFNYMLTPEKLKKDEQGVLYAAAAMAWYGWWDNVNLRWVYYLNHGRPQAKKVETQLTWRNVEIELGKLVDIGKQIAKDKRTKKSAIELPTTPSFCGAYGGCEFQKLCNLSLEERLREIMAAENAGFDIDAFIDQRTEEYKKQANTAAAPPAPASSTTPPPAPSTSTAAPPAPPATTAVPPAPEAPATSTAAPPAPPPPTTETAVVTVAAPPAPPTPPAPPEVPCSNQPPTPEPTEKPPVPQAVETNTAPTTTGQKPVTELSRKELKDELIAAGKIEASSRLATKTLCNMVVELRGMPATPTETAPPTSENTATTSAPPPTPPAVPEIDAPEEKVHDGQPRINVLFVDCAPLCAPPEFKGEIRLFSHFLEPLILELSPDRTLKMEQDYQYGKAAATIAARVQEELRTIDPNTSFICSAKIAEHRECLEVLEAAAQLVIKSF